MSSPYSAQLLVSLLIYHISTMIVAPIKVWFAGGELELRRIRNHACAKCQESSVPCSYTMQLCEGEISSQLALGSLSWNLVWHEFGFGDEDIYGPKQSHSWRSVVGKN